MIVQHSGSSPNVSRETIHASPFYCSGEKASRLRHFPNTQDLYSRASKFVLREYLFCLDDLLVDPLTLQQHEVSAIDEQWLEPRDKSLECLDRACGDNVKGPLVGIFLGAAGKNHNVAETKVRDLLAQPTSAAFERFYEDEIAVGANHREH